MRPTSFDGTITPHSPLGRPPTILHRVIPCVLFFLGIAAWFCFFGCASFLSLGPWGPRALAIFILLVIAAVVVWPVRNSLIAISQAVQFRAFSRRCASAILVGAVSAVYLFLTAEQQARSLRPYLHDEFSYLIQAHQLARGRLWMAPHPLAAFFDSFQLIVQPVYASAYFPGTALLYVPGIWLHLPSWITSLAISGTICGLLFWMVSELIDAIAAMLAILLLLSCQIFRELSFMTMGQTPVLLYGLLATLAWLKWRTNGRTIWVIILGIFLGLAAITRPVDALCFILPLGFCFLLDLRGRPNSLRLILLLILGATPLLLLQLLLNFGVTGHVFQTPFRFYADRDYPNTSYGFHPYDPAAQPLSDLPQKRALYSQEYLPLIERHRPDRLISQTFNYRLPLTLSLGSPTPFPLLIIFIPAALLGLSRPRAVLLAALPLFIGLYSFYVFFLVHYVIVAAPGIILAVIIGAGEIATIFGERSRWISLGLTLFIAGTAIAALPQFDATIRDEMFDAPLIKAVNAQLSELDNAVVLFRYSPNRNVHEEPVYNSTVAWPDEARVIRAHDRGADNFRLFRYYANLGTGRKIYRFDENSQSLTYLGTANDLANASAHP